MKPSTTIHTVQLKNCVVVIKNVPCLKCEQCGEVVLSADTVEKIEHILLRGWKAEAHTDAGAFCAFLPGNPCIFAQVVVILFGSMFTVEICARSSAGRASDF